MTRFSDIARSAAALATGQLGWSPQEFWDATVVDLRTALEGRFGDGAAVPLGRAELAQLEAKDMTDG